MKMKNPAVFALLGGLLLHAGLAGATSEDSLKVRISWGHETPASAPFFIRLLINEARVTDVKNLGWESNDRVQEGSWETDSGGGDVDCVEFRLLSPRTEVRILEKLHSIWADLIAQSDPDTTRRLRLDPAYRLDPRKLTIQMDREGTRGFSVTVDQLMQNRTIWVPSLDVYLSAGDSPVSFADHQRDLEPWKGKRILDQVHREPEATYALYTARWADMGNPGYVNPAQAGPGHIVGLTWDSAIHKFGIDRGAGVWNDYGNPDHFRFWFDFGDLSREIERSWKSQTLQNGYPVLTTVFERDNLRYQVEQFAYPLNGPPKERRGDIPMVLLQKITVGNLDGEAESVCVKMNHRREFSDAADTSPVTQERRGNVFLFRENEEQRILFSIEGTGLEVSCRVLKDKSGSGKDKKDGNWNGCEASVWFDLPGKKLREFVAKLPSPMVLPRDRDRLVGLNYARAQADILKFWSDYVARAAQFHVPEKVVNDLFRATLWHALRLPRRHGGQEPGVRIDLPYSNFAYDQKGTPWPVNQAVYVDYMIYDLRGYHDLAVEELLTMYRNNQEPNGHVSGYANWGVYTPSMIYAVTKNYLLSHDRAAVNQLLPQTLLALDWCLNEIRRSPGPQGAAGGLLRAPLNDGTGEGIWAFNQAYVYAGLSLLGKVLNEIEHPRSEECLSAARRFHRSVEQAFRAAAVRSPLVQLRDYTWIPYVPCEAASSGRIFEQWYPTDVDTGATHLLRLKALPADGDLAYSLLHDHEDNLYLNRTFPSFLRVIEEG